MKQICVEKLGAKFLRQSASHRRLPRTSDSHYQDDHWRTEAGRSRAAASSFNQVSLPGEGRISCAGFCSGFISPSRTSRTTSAFSPPLTRKQTFSAALISGTVNVSRSDFTSSMYSEITSLSLSRSAAQFGNNDAV